MRREIAPSPKKSTPAVALSLLLAACAGPAESVPPSNSAVIIDVQPVAQDEANECGLACVTALCAHHDVVVPVALRESLRLSVEHDGGLRGTQIQETLRDVGLEVFLVEGALEHSAAGLYHQIDLGRPVLVMVATGQEESLHATLVTGYDPALGRVLLLDPQRGPVWTDAPEFDQAWRTGGRYTLVAAPPGSLGMQELGVLSELERRVDPRLGEQLAGDLHLTNEELKTAGLVLLGIVLLAVLI